MSIYEIVLFISCLLAIPVILFIFSRLPMRRAEYAYLNWQLKASKAELNAAILRKIELLESQKAIEHTIDRGTYAVEQGHKLLYSLSSALVDIFSDKKLPGKVNLEKSKEIYDSIRRVNKQINQVASTILQEVPHGLVKRRN